MRNRIKSKVYSAKPSKKELKVGQRVPHKLEDKAQLHKLKKELAFWNSL